MLQLRISVPTADSAAVTALLEGHPGVVGLSVEHGASIMPPGDVIVCNVLREALDSLLGRLREEGVDDRGTIAVFEPRLVLSHAEREAERAVPGSPIDTIVWDEVSARTSEDARMSGAYLILMVCAMLIAGFGVLSDSPILIVAAMVVGPDFGPTAATAVGIASRRWGVARHAFVTLIAGFVAGIAATMVLAGFLRVTGIYDASAVLGPRPQTAFIYEVGWPSVMIALIAGVVGMVSLTTAKSGALIGVFISVTTIPAAANAAVAIVYRIPDEAVGSLLQLMVNILAIQVAAGITLLVQRRLQTHHNQQLSQLLDGAPRASERSP